MPEMQEVVEAVRKAASDGRGVVVGRVVDVKGFSTLPTDRLIAIDEGGTLTGDLLGRPGAKRLIPTGAALAAAGGDTLESVVVSIHGKEVAEVGLACGGQAEVLLQPAGAIPHQLWDLLADRAPAALLTLVDGPGAGPAALVIDRSGNSWGRADDTLASVIPDAVDALAAGRTSNQRLERAGGVVLLETWVPEPRLAVVGTGDLVAALHAQAALLGWDVRATDAVDDVGGLLTWAGATGALIVLSHDPHIDAPALAEGLARDVPYVGALGSRSTQSRRVERLLASGVVQEAIDRIHRPIGLDLGGRRAPEVALAIVAEILACHRGRDARPLRERTGPIHG
jgi:xanthine dehydrogenase accessory factor